VKKQRMSKTETELPDLLQPEREVCMNPWNGVCRNTDIALYIYYGARRLPICRECWREIASDDVEWRYD